MALNCSRTLTAATKLVMIENLLTFSNVAGWRRSSEGNTLLLEGSLEVEHSVSCSQPFRNKDRFTLR